MLAQDLCNLRGRLRVGQRHANSKRGVSKNTDPEGPNQGG